MFVSRKLFEKTIASLRKEFEDQMEAALVALREEMKTKPVAPPVPSEKIPERFGELPPRKQRAILEAKYALKPRQPNPVEQFDAAKEKELVHSQER